MQNLKDTKVIFVDIDRTLTDSNNKVTPKNAEIIKKAVEKGIYVVICSGRNYAYAEQKSKEANASNIIIVNNGSQIYDYSIHKSIYEKKIDKEIVQRLVDELKPQGVEFILNTSNTRFGSDRIQRKMYPDEFKFKRVSDLKDEEVLQIVGEVDDFDTMDLMVKTIDRYEDLEILNLSKAYLEKDTSVKHFYADINNKGVNKGEGIKRFLELYNIKREESVCIGDYINDMDMFDVCGYTVAMQNGSEELKKKADYITLTNNESGVAYFIEKFIL